MIAVVGCGARKLSVPAPACDLYTGSYFRACRRAAEVVAPGRWFILSAQYGLIDPGRVVEPYDLTLGQPGAVEAPTVQLQALILGVAGEPVTALCGGRYAALARRVWPSVEAPLAGLGGMGYQLRALARIARDPETLAIRVDRPSA